MDTEHLVVRPLGPDGRRAPCDDRVITRPDLGLFGVVDGFGGPVWSPHTAALVARSVVQTFARLEGPVHRRLATSFAAAHARALRDTRLRRGGGGATATVVALEGGIATVAHVGAGRLAHRRGRTTRELARDDRLAALCARVGVDAPGTHGREVTTAIGCPGLACLPALARVELAEGDQLLLATDGFVLAPDARASPGDDGGVLVVVRLRDPARRRACP